MRIIITWLLGNLLGIRNRFVGLVDGNWIVFQRFDPKIRYTGNIVVFCHGGFGGSGVNEYHWIKTLTKWNYTVFVPLYPGESESPGRERPRPKDDFREVANMGMWVWRNFSTIRNIYLLGVSRGGWVALQTYVRYPNVFKKVIACVAPTDRETWSETTELPETAKAEALRYFNQVKNWPLDHAKNGKFEGEVNLLYGDRDPIVPAEQGEMLYTTLINDRGTYVEYHTLDGGHSVPAESAGFLRIREWMK